MGDDHEIAAPRDLLSLPELTRHVSGRTGQPVPSWVAAQLMAVTGGRRANVDAVLDSLHPTKRSPDAFSAATSLLMPRTVPSSPANQAALEPLLTTLDDAQLRLLALFAHDPVLPMAALDKGEVDEELMRRSMALVTTTTTMNPTATPDSTRGMVAAADPALPQLAWHRLTPGERLLIHRQLASALAKECPIAAARHRWIADPGPATLAELRAATTASGSMESLASRLEAAMILADQPDASADELLLALSLAEQHQTPTAMLHCFRRLCASSNLTPRTRAMVALWQVALVLQVAEPQDRSRMIQSTPQPSLASEPDSVSTPTFSAWACVLTEEFDSAALLLESVADLLPTASPADRSRHHFVSTLLRRSSTGSELGRAHAQWARLTPRRSVLEDRVMAHSLLAGDHRTARQQLASIRRTRSLTVGYTGTTTDFVAAHLASQEMQIGVALQLLTRAGIDPLAGSHPQARTRALVELLGAAAGEDRSPLPADSSDPHLLHARGIQLLLKGDHEAAQALLAAAWNRAQALRLRPRWQLLADLWHARIALRVTTARADTVASPPTRILEDTDLSAIGQLFVDLAIAGSHAVRLQHETLQQACERDGLIGWTARGRLLLALRLVELGAASESAAAFRSAAAEFRVVGADGWARHAEALAAALLPVADDETAVARTEVTLERADLELIDLIDSGASTKDIAAILFISVRTVEKRLTELYRRFGVRNRRELRTVLDDGLSPRSPG